MALLSKQVSHLADVSALSSRRQLLTASPSEFGHNTDAVREAAISSTLSAPLAHLRSSVSSFVPTSSTDQLPIPTSQHKVDTVIYELASLMPLSAFVDMAGGPEAYAATPASERQSANLRTLRKAVGRNGDTGVRLVNYLRKLRQYRSLRRISGDMWPVYPAILANFAVHLQLTSSKAEATSVAQRCISCFRSVAEALKLPIYVDSPHLGSVPIHQSSGDGYTGHLPLDIAERLEFYSQHGSNISKAFRFDARCAYTIWRGSPRIQDWCRASVTSKSFAPSADIVFNISITKNGEKNTLFALSSTGIRIEAGWHADFAGELSRYGATPRLSRSRYRDADNVPLAGEQLDAKAFGARMFSVILFCALELGYTSAQLKELHVTAHALHGSFAAYGEAAEWHIVPQHKLGRWKVPSAQIIAPDGKRKRGAGASGAKSVAAVYSTAAACQVQLALRDRMMRMIASIRGPLPSGGDLSAFISDVGVLEGNFRGEHGHECIK